MYEHEQIGKVIYAKLVDIVNAIYSLAIGIGIVICIFSVCITLYAFAYNEGSPDALIVNESAAVL